MELLQFQGQPETIAALMADQVDAVMTDTMLLLTSSAGTNGTLQVTGQFDTK